MKIRTLIVLLILSTLILMPFARQADAKNKSYYSGDAISYNGQLVFGTTNMSGMEIFSLEKNKIVRKIKLNSFRAVYSGTEDFRELLFDVEKSRLYVYLCDGPYLYKYNISDLKNALLVSQIQDNSKDWFRGIAKVNGQLVTIGSKGIKVWDSEMQVVATYNFTNKNSHNISFSEKLNYIFNVDGDQVQIFDTKANKVINTIKIFTRDTHARQIYNDKDESAIYVADDRYFKKVNFDGTIIQSFKFTSNRGYDVIAGDGGYIYFSDGLGIVKIRKSDFNITKWTYASKIGDKTSWSMGIRAVKTNTGEKLVVFNNSCISVTDSNLRKIDLYKATEETDKPLEIVSLTIDKNRAAPGSQISLAGKGFGLNEDLEIYFDTQKTIVKADKEGKFTIILTVPSSLPKFTDVRVTGKISKMTYSTSFEIE